MSCAQTSSWKNCVRKRERERERDTSILQTAFRDANSVDGAPTVFIEFVVNRVLCTMYELEAYRGYKWPRVHAGRSRARAGLFTFARQSHARQICIYVSRQVIKGFFNNVSQKGGKTGSMWNVEWFFDISGGGGNPCSNFDALCICFFFSGPRRVLCVSKQNGSPPFWDKVFLTFSNLVVVWRREVNIKIKWMY